MMTMPLANYRDAAVAAVAADYEFDSVYLLY